MMHQHETAPVSRLMRENGNHGDAELERRTERGVTECEEMSRRSPVIRYPGDVEWDPEILMCRVELCVLWWFPRPEVASTTAPLSQIRRLRSACQMSRRRCVTSGARAGRDENWCGIVDGEVKGGGV